jgi:proteasome accessory factor C
VTFELTRGGRWVADYYPYEKLEELAKGGMRLQLRVRDRQWVRRLALRLGPSGRVVEPSDLAAEIAGEAELALRA